MALQQLNEGGTVYVQGSGRTPYAIRKIAGVVDCSCPAWRNMGGGIDTRICKHIKANIAPTCLPRAALSRAGMLGQGAAPVLPAQPVAPSVRLTPKTGKISTAVGGAVKKDTAPAILLAHNYEKTMDPTGYWISEKYDGVRAYWDGGKFISRLGNTFHAPYSFTKSLPTLTHLDGEIWGGRKTFQRVSGICRKHVADPTEWENLKFVVFDAPLLANGRFEDRMSILNQVHAECSKRFPTEMSWEIVKQERCHSKEHLEWVLADMDSNNGEGLMLREPGSLYVPDRSMTCLKVKTFHDAEGVVIGYQPGRGKHKGRVGALICRRPDGVEFEVGTGLTDKQRETPPNVGVTITYSYKELTDGGKPRHASFIGVRDYE